MIFNLLTAEAVTAGALTLCYEDAPTRQILCAGAGGYATTQIYETEGAYLPPEEQSPENVVAKLDVITDPSKQKAMESGGKQTEKFLFMAMAYFEALKKK